MLYTERLLLLHSLAVEVLGFTSLFELYIGMIMALYVKLV